jgi:pimeloyl-ACP methyl ester carboxylesterase
MIKTRRIKTAPGLVFDVSVGGAEDAPLVLMLHGFSVSRHFWSNQIPPLAAAGYFAVAPNQRGYSADARPDPARFRQLPRRSADRRRARHRCGGRAWRAALPSGRP